MQTLITYDTLIGASSRLRWGLERAHERRQLRIVHVGNRPEGHTISRPVVHVKPTD
jgi:hypothetical protein